jgi:hypothetical protein
MEVRETERQGNTMKGQEADVTVYMERREKNNATVLIEVAAATAACLVMMAVLAVAAYGFAGIFL